VERKSAGLLICAVLIAVMVFAGCNFLLPLQENDAKIVSISFEPKLSSLILGETQEFKVIAVYSDGFTTEISGKDVTWEISDSRLATITATGLLTANSPGNVTITITLKSSSNVTNTLQVAISANTDFIVDGQSQETTEDGDTATFSIALGKEPTSEVTISLASSDTSEGNVAPASVTFRTNNWNTPQTVTVTGVDDDQNYSIITGAAVGGNFDGSNPPDVSVTNVDNDTAGISVSPTGGLQTDETGGTDSFTVVLDSEPIADVTLNLSSDNTAEGNVFPISLTFTHTEWNDPQTITVTGVPDSIDDGDLAFTVITSAVASDDGKYNGLDPADVSVVNLNVIIAGIVVTPIAGLFTTELAGIATFEVYLLSAPTANVVIGLSSSNLDEGSVDPSSLTFTDADWHIPITVTVTGVDDSIDDGNQDYAIITAPAVSGDAEYGGFDPPDVSVTNEDDDGIGISIQPTSGLMTDESGGVDTFWVVLDTEPTGSVSIPLTSGNTDEVQVSPASLAFSPSDWSDLKTVTVTGIDDDVDDDDQPFTIITGAAEGSGDYVGVNPIDVSGTNIDDDIAGITIDPTIGLVTSESGKQSSFTIVLDSEPNDSVTIGLSSTIPTEGSVSPTSVVFGSGDWHIPVTVIVTGYDDEVDDGDQNYTIVTSTATTDPKYGGLIPADISAINMDNDTAGVTVTPTSGLTTTEDEGGAIFTVVLDSEPIADVTLNLSSDKPAEGSVFPISLTFTNTDWNAPQTVTVTGVNDAVIDGDKSYTIVLDPVSSSDLKYDGIDPDDVSVTNIDNDVELDTLTLHVTSAAITPSSTLSASVYDPVTFEIIAVSPDVTYSVDGAITVTVEGVNIDGSATGTRKEFSAGTYPVFVQIDVDNDENYLGDPAAIVDIAVSGATDVFLEGDDLSDAVEEPISISGVASLPDGATMIGFWQIGGSPPLDIAAATDFLFNGTPPIPAGLVSIGVLTFDTVLDGSGTTEINLPLPRGTYDLSFGIDAQNDGFGNSGDYEFQVTALPIDGTGTDLSSEVAGITPKPITSEGSTATPVDLSGTLPYPGRAGTNSSYYEIPNITAGQSYTVTLTDITADVDLHVYDDPAFTISLGSSATGGTSDEVVNPTSSDGSLYVEITSLSGGFFTLSAWPEGGYPAEGSIESPVDITSLRPYFGQVDTTNSYYAVTGVTSGETYLFSMTGLQEDLDLYVYSDSGFANLIGSSIAAGTASESTNVIPTGESVYIQVSNYEAISGSTFTLDVTMGAGYVAEGSVADPVDVTGLRPYPGEADTTTYSFYTVSGLTPGEFYQVEITGLSDDLDLYVYDDSEFLVELGMSMFWGTDDEMTVVSPSGSSLYIAIDGFYSVAGSDFLLDIFLLP
jgi:hypothetical protein